MKELVTNEPTMSSLEIADIVEKPHGNVKRTIETLEAKGLIQASQIENLRMPSGQMAGVYHVNQRDSYVVVAQLSPEFTARLVEPID